MKIKSYFAANVAAAIEQARQEMGPEAVIVESRRSPGESRHLGEYEVVVGSAPPQTEAENAPAAAPLDAARFSEELAGMRRQLEMMRRSIARNLATRPRWTAGTPELAEAFSALLAAEVDGELARELMDAVEARGAGTGGETVASLLALEMSRRLRVNPVLGRTSAARRIVALVGPPGSGKTTTLVKLAVTHGLSARRPLQLLSIDNYRVAGAEQLRAYAAILGVGFQAVETTGALGQALEEHRNKDLILIDTPGFAAREMESAAELARFFEARQDIDIHLVLTASTKSADVIRVTERFEIFRPGNLLFTRLDETATWGTVFTLAVRTGRPLSFLGTGQQIPEDLEPAAKERFLDFLVDPLRRSSLAA